MESLELESSDERRPSLDNAATKVLFVRSIFSSRIGLGMGRLIIDNEYDNSVPTASPILSETDNADKNSMYMLLHQKKLDDFELYLESGQKERYFSALSELMMPTRSTESINNDLAIIAYYKIG